MNQSRNPQDRSGDDGRTGTGTQGKSPLRHRRRAGPGLPEGGFPPSAPAEHMEAIVSIARGVSHALNNFIGISRGNLLLVRSGIQERETLEIIDDVLYAVDQVHRLAGNLARISHWSRYAPEALDLPAFLELRMSVFQVQLGSARHLELRVSGHPGPVFADPDYLEIALAALIANADEAAGAKGPIAISCEASFRQDGERNVVLSVKDCGGEVTPSVAAQVFNPGYSSKGTPHLGLGLWLVKEIARACGGEVDFSTGRRPGGTTVSMIFPEHQAAPGTANGPTPTQSERPNR